MNSEKSIRAAYDEIKQRELQELETAVRNNGGGAVFHEDYAPIIMCNFNGYYPHPADVRITRVELLDEEDEEVLRIYGQEKDSAGGSDYFCEEREINVTDIAYGQLSYITQELTAEKPSPFKTTVEQKALIQKLVEAIDACRKAGIQMFTTDGANELLCYNSTDFDDGPFSADNLSGEWQVKEGIHSFVKTPREILEQWVEIPIADCDVIDGHALGVDFISWDCCSGGFFAHKKE